VHRDLAQNINGDEAAVLGMSYACGRYRMRACARAHGCVRGATGAAFNGAALSRQFRVKEVKLVDAQPYAISARFESSAVAGAAGAEAQGGDDDDGDAAPAPTAATAAGAAARTTLPLFPALSPLPKRRQITFTRTAPFSFDLVYTGGPAAGEVGPATAAGDASAEQLLATVQVDGFESEMVKEHLERALTPPKVRLCACVCVVWAAALVSMLLLLTMTVRCALGVGGAGAGQQRHGACAKGRSDRTSDRARARPPKAVHARSGVCPLTWQAGVHCYTVLKW
jgi:hypothetical protein